LQVPIWPCIQTCHVYLVSYAIINATNQGKEMSAQVNFILFATEAEITFSLNQTLPGINNT
jgi:hypothetical protein